MGPLLFILFINDTEKDIHSTILLFADDMKLSAKVKNYDGFVDLKNDAENVHNWSVANIVLLNFNRTNIHP